MELSSINYIHAGKPKIWYVVPPSHAKRFEHLARALFAAESAMCREFLRHKTSLITPRKLQANGIPVHRVVCHANELIITLPRAYHAGFNLGFNVAESVNFATPRWIPFGRAAKHCRCGEVEDRKKRKRGKRFRADKNARDVVKLDVGRMVERILRTDSSRICAPDDDDVVVTQWIQCTSCRRWHRDCPPWLVAAAENGKSFVCSLNTWTSNASIKQCRSRKRAVGGLPEGSKRRRLERLKSLVRTHFKPPSW